MNAATTAVSIFNQAELVKTGELDRLKSLAAEAKLVSVALDRLLNRTALTDGAILIGAAAY
jgi:hypothetical protein